MSATDCLSGGGEMGALMRSLDWSRTPIGPVESWSPALRMMVKFLLANRFPLLLWWGPSFCQLYNDAYRPVLGTKHPQSMGQPTRECWAEIWHIIGPLIETPFGGGEATWMDDILLEINRHGFMEETHFTIAYSPVPDDTVPSRIGGVLATVHEISEKIVGERRVLLLRDLGARSAEAKTADQACVAAAETLAKYPKDAPFALIYLLDSEQRLARLTAAAGVGMGDAVSPLLIDLADESSRGQPWPLAEAVREEAMQIVTNLPKNFSHVPPGPWSDPPQSAVVLPIHSNIPHQLAGLLILGVSSRLRFDDPYHGFCDLVTSQVATAIVNARAYEEERKRADALAEIDRVKTTFFSTVSHEFRTPLTLILGPIDDMLARGADSCTVTREELDMLRRNSQRLLKLVNALLDFSRIEAGRIQASFEPTDLPVFTAELASVFRSAVEKAGLQLSVDCSPLPELVYVDRVMWEKIVLNLLSNAFKFTFAGKIDLALRQAGRYAELCVSDTGIGIPENEIPRIFDRFHRVEGAQGRTYEGSGIGLALVQELARLHGGEVRAESTYGQGSRFIVSIPLGQTHLPAEHVESPRQSFTVGASAYAEEALRWLPERSGARAVTGEATLPPRATARILLADDNADMRGYVQRLLAERYEVQAVADGEAALIAAQENPPDLVLTDIMMPRRNGLGLLQALRADPRTRSVPVILLSARAGEESRVEGLQAGADDYLIKPFSARELLARVGARLELARTRREVEEKERFIERIAELTPVVISVFDLVTGRDIYISRDVANLSGYTQDELEQMKDPVSTLWHPDDVPRHRDHLARWKKMADGEILQFQFRVRRRDGRWRWLETRSMPFLRGEEGDVRQIVAATLDVTARKQAEEALGASEERFRRYFELGLIGMAITSPTKGCLEVNDEICKMLGYERSELLEKTWEEMTHPDDLAADLANFERVMLGECDGYSIDKRWIRKDGRVLHSTISVKCVRREDGAIDYFVALLQDVTARKKAEEALARSHASLERRVANRTRQLTTANQELRKEIGERQRAEAESVALRNALATELEAMTRLHEFSTRLLASTELQPLLEEVLNAIIALQNADFGCIHLYNPELHTLEIVVQRGLQKDFLEHFAGGREGAASYRAFKQRERAIIEDVQTDEGYAPHRHIAASCGFRAAQSTPLFSRRGEPLGVVATHFRQPHRPSERDLRLTDLYAAHAAELIERAQSETAVLRYQQELQTLSAKLIEAQETASKYLARELHDDFSQKLAVLGMDMAALAHSTQSPDLAGSLLGFTAQIGSLAEDIHRISRQLHPAILDDLGLAAALRNECVAFTEQYGIPAEFEPAEIQRAIPEDLSLCLYRVAQECLRNVGKHANATAVRVALRGGNDEIAMEIVDMGDGFEPDSIKRKGGLGLISMEERVRLVNGAISIQSRPGKGTVVNVHVPLP